jgi:hypothetical protein
MAACKDCGQSVRWVRVEGKWRPFEEHSDQEHWLVCQSESAKQLRIRRGKEAGVFPVSPTAVKDYIDCPHYYKLRHVDRIPLPEIRAGLLGRAFHIWAAARLGGKTLEQAQQLVDEQGGVPLDLVADWRYMVESFEYQLRNGYWVTKDAGLEDRLNFEWQDEAVTVQLQVVLDYWRLVRERWPVVTDWKTGRGVDHEDAALFKVDSAWELKKSVQAQSNILVLGKHVPIDGGTFQEVHFRFGGELIGADFELEHLDAFEKALRTQVRRMIRDTDYVPNPYCQVCPVGAHPTRHFPVKVDDKGEVTFRIPKNRDEAERIAAAVLAAKRIYSAGMDVLSPWCASNGNLGGLAHWPQTERRLKDVVERPAEEEGGEATYVTGIEEAMRILEQHGYAGDIPKAVRLDGTWLRSVLTSKKKHVSLAAALEPLIVQSTSTKFEWKKEAPPPAADASKEVA